MAACGKGRGKVMLPRLVKKGGAEVLDTVPLSEETQYQVEFINKPVFMSIDGKPDYRSKGLNYEMSGSGLSLQGALCFSIGVIELPEIPNAMCEDTLLVWEAYRVETEVITQIILGAGGETSSTRTIASVEGPQMYLWAVGGDPLDVIGVNPDPDYYGFSAGLKFPEGKSTVAGLSANRATVTSPNFPIEGWTPDPARNENTKYFGRIIGGSQTPPVVTFGNGSTTPLVDEYGVGPLCLHGACYLTSVDLLGTVGYAGLKTLPGTGAQNRALQCAMGRFFRVHFRQRRVKNPWTLEQMMSQFLKPKAPSVVDPQTEVAEASMVQENGMGSVPPTLEGRIGYGSNAGYILVNGSLVYPDGLGGSVVVTNKASQEKTD
ncbi:TPA_asm: VP1 [Steenbok polyomavirus]|nr:TPA_asm: VP1 [Steenbok polyomavirus]